MSMNDYQANNGSQDQALTAGQAKQPQIPTIPMPHYAPLSPQGEAQRAQATQTAATLTAPTAPVPPAPQYVPRLTPATFAGNTAPATPAVLPVATASTQPVAVSEPQKQKKAKKEKSHGSGKKIAAVAVACCLLGSAAGAGAMLLYTNYSMNNIKSEAVAAAKKAVKKDGSGSSGNSGSSSILQGQRDYQILNTDYVDTSEKHTAAEIYAGNVNSTVGIATSIDYNYYGYKTTAAAAGSGFILTDDGYIVTNYHVVEDATDIKVSTYDGNTYQAQLIGYDSNNDLAVLKINAEGLTPVILGESDHLNVGDEVIAIGNPLGELTFSLTAGCVSALNRTVTINNTPMNLIQTDCAINAGNSGGALFNLYGEVIGITNAKYSNSGSTTEASIENIGFAIPIDSVRDIINNIIEKGLVSKPYIGVYCQMVPQNMKRYGLPDGISIESVIPDSPAEEAGIQNDDIITEINGKEVTDTEDLKNAIESAGPGGKISFKIYRGGEELEIDVTVDEQMVAADHSGTSG